MADGNSLKCIDIQSNYVFDMFNFDNGPDEFSEGLIRIVIDLKIGYANRKGSIIIQPEYACAWPFSDGVAQVSSNCTKTIEYEMEKWVSDEWFLIDRNGNFIESLQGE